MRNAQFTIGSFLGGRVAEIANIADIAEVGRAEATSNVWLSAKQPPEAVSAVSSMEAFGLRRLVAALPPELATKVFFDGYPPATHARGRLLAGGYRKFALPALSR